MSKKKTPALKPDENEDKVTLKPIMRLRPGVYLTILYSFILLVILFFLLIFPGLTNPGAVLIVKTQPAGAGIRVDGVYIGISGDKIFLPKGNYTIDIVMPGFEKASSAHEIPSRLFGSLFFPRQYKINVELKTNDPVKVLAQAAADFASWTFAGEPTAMWQIPMSLSEGAYRAGSYAKDRETKEKFNEILKTAVNFTVTKAALRDLVRAKILVESCGQAPSPGAILNSMSDTLSFLSETANSLFWLKTLLPQDAADAIENSNWYNSNTMKHMVVHEISANRVQQMGLEFINISSNINFSISENPVPRSLFETFLSDNPQWTEHKTDYIPEEIAAIPANIYSRDVITGVTWFAANAFCEWLTGRLPSSMQNMEVRLPSENEWWKASAAIWLDDIAPGYEWCADLYAPYELNINASPEIVELISSSMESIGFSERVLCGRSIHGGAGSFGGGKTRASLPPELSSPFVTFRVVISEKK